jgi:hypothetical protein
MPWRRPMIGDSLFWFAVEVVAYAVVVRSV